MLSLERFTINIPAMSGLNYDEHLMSLGLYSLEFRRMRVDLIETYQIVKGLDKVHIKRMFPLAGRV